MSYSNTLLFSAFCLIFATPLHAQQQNITSVPDEIATYIEARNFVAAYSTPQERFQLARFFETTEAVRDSLGSERLAGVFKRMQRLRHYEVEDDPTMPMIGDYGRPEVAPRELLEVKQVSRAGKNELAVVVVAYGLSSETNASLISSYGSDHAPGEIDPSALSLFRSLRRVQYWTKVGGTWKKLKTETQDLG